MKSPIKKVALLLLSGALLTLQTALAGEVVQAGPYGQGNVVTYEKSPRPTTVAVYSGAHGVGRPDRSDFRSDEIAWQTVTVGNGGPVTFARTTRPVRE